MDSDTDNKVHGIMEKVSLLMPIALPGMCFCALYSAYYLFYVVKRPTIACRSSRFLRFLDRHVPISKEKFWPTWWCYESRFQTVLRAFLQSSVNVHYDSEFITTPDGGEIQLDWSYNNACTTFPEQSRPTVVLMPGLTGSSRDPYVLNMVKDASELGYRCVVFMNRGLGKSKLKTPRTYCAANSEDTEFVIDHVKNRFSQSPLMATGISLGGMILFDYMARLGERAKVEAAMVMSISWNAFSSIESLNKIVNYFFFNRILAWCLCREVKKNIHIFENQLGIDTSHVLKSKTIQDFDERFTRKVFGFSSLHDFYCAASPEYKIHRIAKPVLCLSAADDPFAPQHTIPLNKAQESDNVAIVMTSHGGHIGFMEGTFPRNHNYMNRWFKQYAHAVFSHGHKDL